MPVNGFGVCVRAPGSRRSSDGPDNGADDLGLPRAYLICFIQAIVGSWIFAHVRNKRGLSSNADHRRWGADLDHSDWRTKTKATCTTAQEVVQKAVGLKAGTKLVCVSDRPSRIRKPPTVEDGRVGQAGRLAPVEPRRFRLRHRRTGPQIRLRRRDNARPRRLLTPLHPHLCRARLPYDRRIRLSVADRITATPAGHASEDRDFSLSTTTCSRIHLRRLRARVWIGLLDSGVLPVNGFGISVRAAEDAALARQREVLTGPKDDATRARFKSYQRPSCLTCEDPLTRAD